MGRLPTWFRSFFGFVVNHLLHDPVTAATIAIVGSKTSDEMTSWIRRRDNLRQEWNDWFLENEFDALIAPTSTIPATKINGTTMVSALAETTFLYNVLDWPVGVLPVTKVQKGEDIEESEWKTREGYSWMLMDYVYGKKGCYKDIRDDGVGLPVGVQVHHFWGY
jgi:amidase